MASKTMELFRSEEMQLMQVWGRVRLWLPPGYLAPFALPRPARDTRR